MVFYFASFKVQKRNRLYLSSSNKNQSFIAFETKLRKVIKTNYRKLWGYSAVGSALAWHARGHEFESR